MPITAKPQKSDPGVKFDFDPQKAVAVILYLASKPTTLVPGFDRYKAAKLIFLADKYHLVRFGRPIVGDKYCGVEYGPIPVNALDLLNEVVKGKICSNYPDAVEQLKQSLEVDSKYQHPRLSSKVPPDLDVLSQSDLEALDHVIEQHGKKGFGELKVLTHQMPAYKKAWESRGQGQSQVDIRYEDFFEQDDDAIVGAFEEMLEDSEMRKSFPGNPKV